MTSSARHREVSEADAARHRGGDEGSASLPWSCLDGAPETLYVRREDVTARAGVGAARRRPLRLGCVRLRLRGLPATSGLFAVPGEARCAAHAALASPWLARVAPLAFRNPLQNRLSAKGNYNPKRNHAYQQGKLHGARFR